jgi:hypothetical protein
MGSRAGWLCAAVLAATMFVGGCGWLSTEYKLHRVGPQPAYSDIWSAEPGVDLFSRSAELVRAVVEAGRYTAFAGFGPTFPGYRKAIGNGPEDYAAVDVDYVFRHGPGTLTYPKTKFNRITGLSESETEISAVVCTFDMYEDPTRAIGLDPTLGALDVRLTNPSGDPGLPGSPDLHPESEDARGRYVPDWNVFGSWRIVALEFVRSEVPTACKEWFQPLFPSFRTDIFIMRAPPGFVAPAMPVGIRYPEWIGPSED